jgi:hypothetical protein
VFIYTVLWSVVIVEHVVLSVRWCCCSVLVNDSATSYRLHAAIEYHKREIRLRLCVHL